MHVQSCYFGNLNLFLFWRSRWHTHRRCLSSSLRELKKERRWRLRKRHLKKEFALPQTLSCLFQLDHFKHQQTFLELNSKECIEVQERKRKSLSCFTCSTKLEFRHSHVVVVQWRQRNVHKKRDARAKLLLNLLRTLRSNDADSNENVKKPICLISKTTTSHVHHAFLYLSFLFLHDYDVKMPNFAFYGGRKQATTKFYFSFWAWIWSLEIQLQEGSPTFDKVSG